MNVPAAFILFWSTVWLVVCSIGGGTVYSVGHEVVLSCCLMLLLTASFLCVLCVSAHAHNLIFWGVVLACLCASEHKS